jgi:hypothetical protein
MYSKINFFQRIFSLKIWTYFNNIIGVKTTKVVQYDNPSRNLHYNNPWEKQFTKNSPEP